jgi:hypothetical protein
MRKEEAVLRRTMRPRPWLVLLACVASFGLGVLTAPWLRPTSPSRDVGEGTDVLRDNGVANLDKRSDGRSDRRPGRPQQGPSGRLSVSDAGATELMERFQRPAFGFLQSEDAILSALGLVGVERQTQDAVLAQVRSSNEEIAAAEKRHLKISQPSESEIVGDLSGVVARVPAILQHLKDEIQAKLTPGQWSVVESVITWDGYYAPASAESVSFRLIRQQSGDLISVVKVGEIQECGTMETRFQSDSTSIEAAQVFGRHWEPYLQGFTLVPIDQK